MEVLLFPCTLGTGNTLQPRKYFNIVLCVECRMLDSTCRLEEFVVDHFNALVGQN